MHNLLCRTNHNGSSRGQQQNVIESDYKPEWDQLKQLFIERKQQGNGGVERRTKPEQEKKEGGIFNAVIEKRPL